MIPRKQILSILATLIIFVSIVNFLATKAMWYYIFWWFDMPMHFLGGLVVALLISYIFYKTILQYPLIPVAYILLGVFVVGFGWEVFEYIFNNLIAGQAWILLDTLSDLCFDLAGGMIGLLMINDSFKFTKPV
jgi:hypothetical protein